MSSTIICVDDDKFLVDTLAEQIRGWIGENYVIEKALSGPEALEILDECAESGTEVPLVISDYIMPSMNGAELLIKVHARDKNIKKIMLTGYSAIDGIVSAINNASLYRFISKPWNNRDLMLTVLEALRSYEQEKKNQLLLQSFEKLYRGYEVQLNYMIKTVGGLIDIKSECEIGHSNRVAQISNALGQKARLNADALKALKVTASFHDIGRLALGEDDINDIKNKEALIYDFPKFIKKQNAAAERIFTQNPQFDKQYLNVITTHYEKFNGTGIKGLQGGDIPIEARIIGIANFYAVLTSDSGNKALKHSSAVAMITSLKSTIYDPELVNLFTELDESKLY